LFSDRKGKGSAGFSCFYSVEGVSFIYLLLCEGGGIISVLGGVLLVRVAGDAGNCGSTNRAPTPGSVTSDFFLPLPSMPRGWSMFVHRVQFILAGGRGDGFYDFSKVWHCMDRWEVDSVPRCWSVVAAGHGPADGVRLGWKKYLCCIFCLLQGDRCKVPGMYL
jgi:hypothetical protein